MTEVRLSRDVRPLSEFRANVAAFVEKVQATKQPMILTQHGRSAVVLLGIDSYERLIDTVELLRDVRGAEKQIVEERGREHARVEARLRSMLGR
jgi:antitoxin YefM